MNQSYTYLSHVSKLVAIQRGGKFDSIAVKQGSCYDKRDSGQMLRHICI